MADRPRLLDFTRSFYAAAFFAIEFATRDACIWAINLAVVDEANDLTVTTKQALDENNREYNRRVQQVLSRTVPEQPGIMPVEPDRLNERMSIQQGVFLFPTAIEHSLIRNLAVAFQAVSDALAEHSARSLTADEFLANVFEHDSPSLVKFVLPRTVHEEAMRDLVSMNMTANSLFPGLDGFARSLHRHLRYWRTASAG